MNENKDKNKKIRPWKTKLKLFKRKENLNIIQLNCLFKTKDQGAFLSFET